MTASSQRIPLPDLARLSDAQQQVANQVAAGPRGEVRGPVRVWLHSPQLADRAQKLGETLRWGSSLEPRICELVILVTCRHYDSHYMWFNHVKPALNNGLSQLTIDAIKSRRKPVFDTADEAAAYALATEVLNQHEVSDTTLTGGRAIFGDRGVIEIGAIIGHYHSGAIALGLADVTLPDGSKTCLPP